MTLTEPDINEIERIVDERISPLLPVVQKVDKILAILSDLTGQLKS